jgi:hypothetical protein
VNSDSGKATFSASVIELQSVRPLVKHSNAAQQGCALRLFCPREVDLAVENFIFGRFDQSDQVVKQVLLPHPVPSMMIKISPGRTMKFRSRITTKLPYFSLA